VIRLFAPDERVLLVDNRRRRHLVVLVEGGQFHTHAGIIAHDDIIGLPDGSTVRTTRGARLTALKPTLSEYILEMPRGAQVIYPKDIGPILMLADIFPGARIVESGVGSGALTSALLRAIGPTGSVVGYEIRDDFAKRATENVHGFLGPDVPLDVQVRDVYEGIDEREVDRVVLDLPEPWRVVKHAAEALVPGGIMIAYLPTILQVGRLREELNGAPFAMIESLEVLHRTWHVEGQSIRPDHRMVAHTGFLTVARRLADDPRAPEPASAPEAELDAGPAAGTESAAGGE
jgi:tRNA (adenine57-N1/adenine58-N1)-methyltransferase